jgi:1,4-alpha-glucan branching enzyme
MQRLGEAARGTKDKKMDELERRILQQAGRELLLLQSSDWPFMITRQATPDHAGRRIVLHRTNFQQCVQMAEQYQAGETLPENDWHVLEQMERQHPLFQDLDPSIFWPGPDQ